MPKERLTSPVTVTREELYRQVWETPMSRLAVSYGITGNGLAKVCDRLNVPYPPRGYWAKKAAGKPVVQYRLPEAERDTPPDVTITPTLRQPERPTLPAAVEAQVEGIRKDVERMAVPERLMRPHVVIAGWLAERKRKAEEARSEHDPWRRDYLRPKPLTETDRRRHRLLDTMFKALERQKVVVKAGDHGHFWFEANGERIDVKIRERQRYVKRPKTLEEMRWRTPGDRDWTKVLEGLGELEFSIQTYLPANLPRRWIDRRNQPLETQLGDIVATIVGAGPLLVELRKERAEAEHRRLKEERRRYEEQRRCKLDHNRWRRLVEIAKQWQEAKLARDFLELLARALEREGVSYTDKDGRDWLEWARAAADRYDPLAVGPEAVFRTVADVTEWTYRDEV